jgi:hypothetical protein
MSSRWHPVAGLAVILFAVSCASPAIRGQGGTPAGRSAGPVPFDQFIHAVSAARYSSYAGRPGVAVRDQDAFEQMRRYLLQHYAGVTVVRSYVADGATFDCIKMAATTSAAPPSHPATTGQAHSPCPPDAIPVRRVSLGQLVRFPTLRAFLGKDPGGGGLPPAPSPSG